jgi:flagellin-like hook-associated protein FlgL
LERTDIQSESVNWQASLSTIQDADIAKEQMELTKLQILQSTTLAMLAQNNTAPAALLSLF